MKENKHRLTPMEKEKFLQLIEGLQLPESFDINFIYEMYETVLEGLGEVEQKSDLLRMEIVDHPKIVYYLLGEHYYYTFGVQPPKVAELLTNTQYQSFLLSSALDKYLTNGHLEYKLAQQYSPFSPPISTLELYLNFTLGILTRFKKREPTKTLIVDTMTKALTLGKGIINLLKDGFETEAFAIWRTLHETECVLILLDRYQTPAIQAYLTHLNYGLAFRGGITDKEKNDQVFAQIKEKMREHGLKSKDMKRFIEYGWLYDIPGIDFSTDYKLNFRDGLEKVAGLSAYSRNYEMASEVAHSSPLLIYAKDTFFGSIALINLYESFFRIEEIFRKVYLSAASDLEKRQYDLMRRIYSGSMKVIHEREVKKYLRKFGKRK
ncbi:MAG: DUF5677 domain-containing protein [Bacilli bacterium]